MKKLKQIICFVSLFTISNFTKAQATFYPEIAFGTCSATIKGNLFSSTNYPSALVRVPPPWFVSHEPKAF